MNISKEIVAALERQQDALGGDALGAALGNVHKSTVSRWKVSPDRFPAHQLDALAALDWPLRRALVSHFAQPELPLEAA